RRNRPCPPARAHQQRLGDSQRKRQADMEARALAAAAADVDPAAGCCGLCLDHVHAHAASGDGRELGRGAEARDEDQVGEALVVRVFVRTDEAARARALGDTFEV
ncbi:hypothetical protein RZS08_49695, partial [Arthrospira platensis SPKY1]|nr:hypothetical protein [Arthrospira platensis SPKY1]